MLTVACVLRSGGPYNAEYVERLQAGVARHLAAPHRFICFSDAPVGCERIPIQSTWTGWFAKMELYRPPFDDDFLYFDLDTIIVGDLSDIARVRELTLLSDFNVPHRTASGVMFLPKAERKHIWREWIKDPQAHMQSFPAGDGDFLRSILGSAWGERPQRWQTVLPGQFLSYKNFVRWYGLTDKARVVCFHGQPRPRDVGWSVTPLSVSSKHLRPR